ncbi:hypothetical protein H0E87_022314 [Populus deltoides]|uniref:PB1 domain-containing protein n=1 Tax=Populus deltoides TaxID=3696 RepID=A0A8T2XLH9_POPDE|nr:hypothetical protein H0E87_022314 [Populus deltoides]
MSIDCKTKTKPETLKFLCSYGGKILPRSSDGVLRYVGGLTRVLAVDRSICYSELMVKLGEFCGYSVELRCQLPDGDLETLISVKSEDELKSLITEFDRSCPGSKIRAILCPPKSLKKISPRYPMLPVSTFQLPNRFSIITNLAVAPLRLDIKAATLQAVDKNHCVITISVVIIGTNTMNIRLE